MPALARFWGKARSEEDTGGMAHPLVAHCLDVAAVAVLLSDREARGLDPRMLGFLVALHDIGKFSRPFQAQARYHWPTDWLGPCPTDRQPGPRHDAIGFHFLSRTFATPMMELLPEGATPGSGGWNQGDRNGLWRALAGHHGRPPDTLDRLGNRVACAPCIDAAGQFLAVMREVFRPPPWPRPAERAVTLLSWCLAGLTTLADWIGSRQSWFPYVTAGAVADPAAYFWGHALPRAAAALAEAGLAHARAAPFNGLRGLFPGITTPTPVQAWAETVPLPEGPSLTVIEDLTGSGKTEAAVTLAHRLLASGRGRVLGPADHGDGERHARAPGRGVPGAVRRRGASVAGIGARARGPQPSFRRRDRRRSARDRRSRPWPGVGRSWRLRRGGRNRTRDASGRRSGAPIPRSAPPSWNGSGNSVCVAFPCR